jgi:hypothetical protein
MSSTRAAVVVWRAPVLISRCSARPLERTITSTSSCPFSYSFYLSAVYFDVWYVTWPYGLARCCVILSIKMDAAATNLSMSQSSRNRLTALESMSYNICKLLRALLWFTVLLQRLVDEFQLKSILNFVFTSNIQCALSFVDRFN